METRQSAIQNVLAQLEGLSYREAEWILECAKSKIKDCSSVQKYIPKVRHESQPAFKGDFFKPSENSSNFDTAVAQLHFDIDKIIGCDFYRKKFLNNQRTASSDNQAR